MIWIPGQIVVAISLLPNPPLHLVFSPEDREKVMIA